MGKIRILFALALLAFGSAAFCASPQESAEALFKRYESLGSAYDVALADLYSDAARISNRRTYPSGEVRELSLPAAQYKDLIRAAMPLAQSRGDRSRFTDVRYETSGDEVRITATRHSELKQYASPLILVVGADASGEWLILEEHSESRP